ncbi:MAG: MBL fold metallo-hydrolase [Gammaproteobacteria bacterium]|jgi:glyoxylase-like metal-dependent hydrolase (beta-lactamase superfamily II)|nr:MBL fold metallo-hydrolase [Gammaproteobacteria bacterium]MBU0773165.1 MBL fold metallo-hydrolase [Gammaproteobacteria bacterium]MBU0855414.1 MBL fold metallo-hydrolase [Gammaproteobacteria bacterium]MBU1848900.1 MBL fold metallo-hydrolase [Gammaproteobacteria bacterium]
MIDYEHGISAIDADLIRHGMASIHLLRAGDQAALVDCGTGHSLGNIRAALDCKGIAPGQLRYIILTHVHLDHASGAGAAMRAFPDARLVVHPRGARHMIDPSKLIAGATEVYGEQAMADMYGDILPVAADRVIETHDGFTLDFNGRTLAFIDTPGHAKHHHCIWDALSQSWFTGDTFGLAYPECTVDGRAFVFPTTSPVQFDPDALRASVGRLLARKPRAMYLTHYGRVTDVPALGRALLERIDAHVAIARAAAGTGGARKQVLVDALSAFLLDELDAHGCTLTREEALAVWGLDIELNAQGLAFWLDHATG